MTVMRRQRWADMSDDARDGLCARGLDDIFDPVLRASIGELIDDVRQRGDAAVCDALARHDGVVVEPDGLRITDDELDQAAVDPAVDAAIDDAITHLRAFNEQQLARTTDWSFEWEPGLTVGEKVTPVSSAGLFTPSGKASYPSVTYQLAVPAVVAGVPELALVVPPVPVAAARSIPQCSSCAASSAYATCSGSTARPASPRWGSAPSRSPRSARSSAPARRP